MKDSLLQVEELSVSFESESGTSQVLDQVTFALEEGTTLGLAGESGCGKSVSALSIMRLLPHPYGRIDHGRILFSGADIVSLPPEHLRKIRGNQIAMIFQEPLTALNPVHRVGRQIDEVFRLHRSEMNKPERLEKSIELLRRVGIPEPERRIRSYPHQLSGGMRQRVMIAMALALRPKILIADEPTTALDVTIQAQILELIGDLRKQEGMAVIFITHDMGVIKQMCDRLVVMYAGRVVEQGKAAAIFDSPAHPYTQGLIDSMPRLSSKPKSRLPTIAGRVPSSFDFPVHCRFADRCPYAASQCRRQKPPLLTLDDRQVRCLRLNEVWKHKM